ncbi:MAG: AAA family ATPase [Armatimonadota bacterium]
MVERTYVKAVHIEGLWGQASVDIELHRDMNILIGENGTGKTTVIRLIYAVMTCQVPLLADTGFRIVELQLQGEDSSYQITVKPAPRDRPGTIFDYSIAKDDKNIAHFQCVDTDSHTDFSGRLLFVGKEPGRTERWSEERSQVLDEIVDVHWLSVHRWPQTETRHPRSRERVPPIDEKLKTLEKAWGRYQLILENRENEATKEFQRDIMLNLLLDLPRDPFYADTTAQDVKAKLGKVDRAFRELGIKRTDYGDRLNEWRDKLMVAFRKIDRWKQRPEGDPIPDLEWDEYLVLILFGRVDSIVDTLDTLEDERRDIFELRDQFIATCNTFFRDKTLEVASGSGELTCFLDDRSAAGGESNEIPLEKLSSGEKQLLVLFLETVVQDEQVCVFIADEPEISLHVRWQQKLLAKIKELNPNSQVIVATHSPDIASHFTDKLIQMEQVLRV